MKSLKELIEMGLICVRDGSRMAETAGSVYDSPAPKADAKAEGLNT